MCLIIVATAKRWQRVTNPMVDQCLGSFREVMEVGEEWSLDTIGPLEPDEDGNCFITVAVDGFSRYVMLEPAKDNSGDSAAHFLLKIAQWNVRTTKGNPN